ncbi:MAG: nucleotide sugar dehydrogenase [Rhodobacteraceae bacterium]|nr:nucleotide sugar dehydrogenase [Paracoccaceae bacterium]
MISENHTAPNARIDSETVAVIGLGYVGLPLAVRLAEIYRNVLGFELSNHRVDQLRKGIDVTLEVDNDRLLASGLNVSADSADLADATFYVVAVPTPITEEKRPDLRPLESACKVIGPYLRAGNVVVFESTVYPGLTEEFCGPLLEQGSGLICGKDFNLGYSPERINPGDKTHQLETIVKPVSADSPEALARVAALYERVVTAGIYRCSSIKVAEAAKVMENTQRDLNIALMNELSQICEKIGISTNEVIDAASTKWNFMPFRPGLVGGHCIGVDPYYMAALSERVGHHPEVILAGRRLNDAMPERVAASLIKRLALRGGPLRGARVGFFGVTFKENIPDLRNSKSIELINELEKFGLHIWVGDAVCDPEDAARQGVSLTDPDKIRDLDMMVMAVAHDAYRQDPDFLARLKPDGVLCDIRGIFRGRDLPKTMDYWSL